MEFLLKKVRPFLKVFALLSEYYLSFVQRKGVSVTAGHRNFSRLTNYYEKRGFVLHVAVDGLSFKAYVVTEELYLV